MKYCLISWWRTDEWSDLLPKGWNTKGTGRSGLVGGFSVIGVYRHTFFRRQIINKRFENFIVQSCALSGLCTIMN